MIISDVYSMGMFNVMFFMLGYVVGKTIWRGKRKWTLAKHTPAQTAPLLPVYMVQCGNTRERSLASWLIGKGVITNEPPIYHNNHHLDCLDNHTSFLSLLLILGEKRMTTRRKKSKCDRCKRTLSGVVQIRDEQICRDCQKYRLKEQLEEMEWLNPHT